MRPISSTRGSFHTLAGRSAASAVWGDCPAQRNCAQVPRHVHSTVAEDIAQESAYQRSQAEAAMERMKHWLARLAFDLGPVDIDGDLCATHP
ncbi:hypothetical protein G6F64_015158 [Rhizopus arrhizus]|uniref:Uncharacterized protein n=1 Tax=Rhizopus oryzae TaxID=64495 RepID=A0A9P6WSM5_RHIOR|nr:hypothetical protein G6F64_015158 [Rhizopus arrhizus]